MLHDAGDRAWVADTGSIAAVLGCCTWQWLLWEGICGHCVWMPACRGCTVFHQRRLSSKLLPVPSSGGLGGSGSPCPMSCLVIVIVVVMVGGCLRCVRWCGSCCGGGPASGGPSLWQCRVVSQECLLGFRGCCIGQVFKAFDIPYIWWEVSTGNVPVEACLPCSAHGAGPGFIDVERHCTLQALCLGPSFLLDRQAPSLRHDAFALRSA